MKRTFFLAFIFASIFSFLSCTNDDYANSAQVPVFKQLILSPSVVSPGEEVNATVEYEFAGKEIYSNKYKLTISEIGNPDNTKSLEWEEIEPMKSVPQHTFNAPDSPGRYSVVFQATRINFSTGGPNGSLYGSANSVSAILTVIDND